MGVRSRLTKAVLNLVPRDHDISNVTSRELVRNKDLAVILHTCDAYEFCWTGWHFYFSRHWDTKLDCNIYFANESSACNFPDVSHLPTGSGPWADRLMRALESIREDYVFYLQEDFWPTQSIDLKSYYQIARALDADALRITADSDYYCTYRPFQVCDVSVRRFALNSRYLVSHAPSIWKREFLLSCLESGESPWQNELNGTSRLRMRNPKIFLCVDDWYVPTCRKGNLTAEGLKMNQATKEASGAAA